MAQRTWFITGVSSGFGRELTEQLLKRDDRVIGTIRDTDKLANLREQYPETFRAAVLDVTDTAAVREVDLIRSYNTATGSTGVVRPLDPLWTNHA